MKKGNRAGAIRESEPVSLRGRGYIKKGGISNLLSYFEKEKSEGTLDETKGSSPDRI